MKPVVELFAFFIVLCSFAGCSKNDPPEVWQSRLCGTRLWKGSYAGYDPMAQKYFSDSISTAFAFSMRNGTTLTAGGTYLPMTEKDHTHVKFGLYRDVRTRTEVSYFFANDSVVYDSYSGSAAGNMHLHLVSR